ncbi:hypothetical protein F2Q69_00029249 [Brassica cretica]|uniref:Uncharacterized protein n=1 Tax=Brassica cretica TaxID=69181 RepID=A0A8S9S2N1_BRACR|nr:hypothetical protein F2Q69_00029249 [Brassica cretica]
MGCTDVMDFKMAVVVWAIQSMEQHQMNRMIFPIQDEAIVGMVLRPKAWPLFKFMSSEITKNLAKLE